MAIDAIARYWESLAARPVREPTHPGALLAKLPAHAPELGRPLDDAVRDLASLVAPHLTHWQHPHFYAFFPANISTPAVIGELLAAGLGQQGMLWATSPACTELEIRVLDWLAEALDLPAAFRSTSTGGGVIQGTASEATLAALVAARDRTRRALRAAGRSDRPYLTLYTSTQAHSSVIKAAMIAGLADTPEDRAHLRLIDTDPATHAMRPEALRHAISEDLAAGRVPCFVCATIGTTSSTAIDPVDQIAGVIASTINGAAPACPPPWLHVDAAHAGACLLCPELRGMAKGLDRADSFCFNPHKWLLTNFDCDCFYVADRRALINSMSVTPEYLRNQASDSGQVTDFRDWHVPLGRRFRALKLWLVLSHFGLEQLRTYVREHIRLASWLEDQIASDPRFELAAPRTMNLVCFRLRAPGGNAAASDRLTRELLESLNASGRVYLTHTVLSSPDGPRYTIRVCIGSSTTKEHHVRELWTWIQSTASGLAGPLPS